MKKRNNETFISEFYRVKSSIQKGTTPVFSELRNAKTSLLELIPYLTFQAGLLALSTWLVNQLNLNEIAMIVIVLVVNTTTATISQCLLVFLKHALRIRKLKKYNIEVSEENIAVLECMEYQSV